MAGQNNGKQGGQQQDVNQLLKVRREKLANLQEAGQDPFQITKYDVTHHTSDVKDLYNAHEEKLLAGTKLVKKLPQEIFMKMTYILLLLSGVMAIV